MHRSRIVLVGAALVALAAMPLPHLQADLTGSVNGVTGDAWPAAVALVLLALLALVGDRAEGFGPGRVLVGLMLAGFAVVFTAVKAADASQAADLAGGSIGYGVWVLAVGAVLGVVGTLASISRTLG